MAVVALVVVAAYAAVAWLVVSVLGTLLGWALADPLTVGWFLANLVGGFVAAQYVIGRRLAVLAVGARDLPASRYPWVHEMVDQLADALGIDKPRVMVAEMGVPNAFAVGRRGSSTVVVSVELLRLLDRGELAGVLAHELAHVHNRDSILMTIVASVRRIVTGVVSWVVVLVVAGVALIVRAVSVVVGADRQIDWPRVIAAVVAGITVTVLAVLLVFTSALSRRREYAADRTAVRVLGRPDGLARALRKIERASGRLDRPFRPLGPHDPGRDRQRRLERLFSSHPPLDERIDRLYEAAERHRA